MEKTINICFVLKNVHNLKIQGYRLDPSMQTDQLPTYHKAEILKKTLVTYLYYAKNSGLINQVVNRHILNKYLKKKIFLLIFQKYMNQKCSKPNQKKKFTTVLHEFQKNNSSHNLLSLVNNTQYKYLAHFQKDSKFTSSKNKIFMFNTQTNIKTTEQTNFFPHWYKTTSKQ